MNGLFDLTTPEPVPDESLHYLVVHERPEDGIDIEHPDDCPFEDVQFAGQPMYRTYKCAVASQADEFGIDYFFRHCDDPEEDQPYQTPQRLKPGRYLLNVWSSKTWTDLGYEYDAGLEVTP